MRVLVIAVGKLKERGAREWIDDYARRIGRYAEYQELELRDGALGEVEERLRKAVPPRAQLVALEVQGKVMSSVELARFVGRCEESALGPLAFLVGGAYGLPPAVSQAAQHRLSLSALTLPHRLARLVLVEQIYRAFTIVKGEPYHK